MFEGEENNVDIIISHYCFICGSGFGCPRGGGGGGGVGGRRWSDMRKLLELLCKLMTVVVPGWKTSSNDDNHDLVEGEEEEEGCWDSQTCGHCYNVMIQMEQLNALLERTRKSLADYVQQVESLVVKSRAAEENDVSCQTWTAPFRTFREQVFEASLRTARFQAEQVPMIPPPPNNVKVEEDAETGTTMEWEEDDNFSHEEEHDSLDHNVCDPLLDSPTPPEGHRYHSLSESNSLSTAHAQPSNLENVIKTEHILESNIINQSKTTNNLRSSSRNPAVTSCFVRLEKVVDTPNVTTIIMPSKRAGGGRRRSRKKTKLSRNSRKSTQSADSDYEPGQKKCNRSRTLQKRKADIGVNKRTRNNGDTDDDHEGGGSGGDMDINDPPANESSDNVDDDDDIDDSASHNPKRPGRLKKSRFGPFVTADASKGLYLFRQGTFVSKTDESRLVCHAFGCEFSVEFSFYTAFQEMKTHVIKCHSNVKHRQKTQHPCLLCHKTFSNQLTFRAHLPRQHEHLLVGNSTAICECCLKPLRSSAAGASYQTLRTHMFTHKSEEEKAAAIASGDCTFQSRTTTTTPKDKVPLLPSQYKYKCSWEGCQFRAKAPCDLRRHTSSHLPPEQRPDFSACDQCGAFIRSDYLKDHVLRMHQPELAESILKCSYCDKKYFPFQRARYEAHLRMHRGERPFMCSECGAAFSTNATLNAHIKNRHAPPPETPHKCDHCDKTYTKLGSLEVHLRRLHPELAPRKWNNRKGASKLNAVDGDEEDGKDEVGGGGEKREKPVYYGPIQRWPCSICDTTVSKKWSLKLHMRTQHGDQKGTGATGLS